MQMMLACLAGIEAETRLARVVDAHQDDASRDMTSVLGMIGAAAAASHLLALVPPATATALAIATSLAGGPDANSATMTQPLHAGQTARNGLMAALLAEAGYEANHFVFEHARGFCNAFNEPAAVEIGKALDGWGDDAGRDGDTAASSDALWEKFNDCARRALPREQIAPLFERLETFDAAADVNQITQLMQVSHLHDRGTPKPVSFAPRGTEESQETAWVP
jgi:2-methylcitrate dehydratase PrpD